MTAALAGAGRRGLLCGLLCLGHALALAAAVVPGLSFAAEPVWTHQGEQRFVLRRVNDSLVLGHALYRWRHNGKRYELHSTTETTGLLAALSPTKSTQESRGVFLDGNFRPESFTHEKKRATEHARFDWSAGQLSYRDQQVPLPEKTQDLLSVYAQLAMHPPPDGHTELPVATGTNLAVYRFESDGADELQMNGQRYQTTHLHVVLEHERLDLWLPVPTKAGLPAANGRQLGDIVWPVRIRLTDKNGTVLDQSVDADGSAR